MTLRQSRLLSALFHLHGKVNMTNAEADSKPLGSSIAPLIELKGHDKKLLTFQFRRCRVQVNLG